MRRFIPLAWRGFSWLGVALAVRLAAQDVTIAPLAWLEPRDAPETLPVQRSKLHVEFPEDLRKTPDVGWAMIDLSLDRDGKVTAWTLHATQPAYARAVELGDHDTRKFQPGRRAGVPVNTRTRLTVIFNAATAKAKAAGATPRLIDAAVVVDPGWKPTWNGELSELNPQRVMWATVAIDAQGAVSGLEAATPEATALLKTGLSAWRFLPARKGGQPVAAELRVPFIVVPADNPEGRDHVPPRGISRPLPAYPVAMRRSGLRGDVVVEFTVDREGRVRNATVVRTLNPAFDEPALAAVRTWKFDPGRVDGRAVDTRLLQPISFALDDSPDGGDDGLEVRRRGDPRKLPPQLAYDTPPKIQATVVPKYPYELLKEGRQGTAQVSLLIDTQGKVAYSRIIQADRPEFGLALQAATELFEYFPALKNGQPTPSLIGFEQEFRIYGEEGARIVADADREALAVERKHPERILKARDLDGPLQVVSPGRRFFPAPWRRRSSRARRWWSSWSTRRGRSGCRAWCRRRTRSLVTRRCRRSRAGGSPRPRARASRAPSAWSCRSNSRDRRRRRRRARRPNRERSRRPLPRDKPLLLYP